MTHQESISLRTSGHHHMQDLTPEVASILSRSGVTTGTAHVFNVGSTGVVGTIEFEPGLERDLPEILDKLLPPNREYGHEQAWRDGNMDTRICRLRVSGPTSPFLYGTVDCSWEHGSKFFTSSAT